MSTTPVEARDITEKACVVEDLSRHTRRAMWKGIAGTLLSFNRSASLMREKRVHPSEDSI
jgi:hypothetical protein